MPLTALAVRKAKPRDKPYKLFDERGLFLLVNPTGSKLWRFKYRFGKKEKQLATILFDYLRWQLPPLSVN